MWKTKKTETEKIVREYDVTGTGIKILRHYDENGHMYLFQAISPTNILIGETLCIN